MSDSGKRERALHAALDALLALFWTETQGLNVREIALDALALRPDLPVTVRFAGEVQRRAALPETERDRHP